MLERRCSLPGSYSTDLRERVLVAVEAGEPVDAVAEQFMVGRSSVYRWIAAARDEGRRAAKRLGGGPKPIIRDETEAALRRLLEADNHLTLAECRDRLAEATGVRVDPWTIGGRCGGSVGRGRNAGPARRTRTVKTWRRRGRAGRRMRPPGLAGSRWNGWCSSMKARC